MTSLRAKSPRAAASLRRVSGWATTAPAPSVRCPTSELPIWPSGRPTLAPDALSSACGKLRQSSSITGVSASEIALPGPGAATPQPSSTIRQTCCAGSCVSPAGWLIGRSRARRRSHLSGRARRVARSVGAERLERRQTSTLKQLQRRASARGEVVDLAVEPQLPDGGDGLAPADDAHRAGLRDRLGDHSRAVCERLALEHSHRPVPEHGAGARDRAREMGRAAWADVAGEPAARHVLALGLVPRRLGAQLRRATTRSSGRPSSCRAPSAAASVRRADSTSSGAHGDRPVAWPCAARNGKLIAPPISTVSAI